MSKATGRPCTVCAHPDLGEINSALARGGKYLTLSRRFGVSRDALRNHGSQHIPKAMALAAEALGSRDLAAGLGLNDEARELYIEARSILAEARAAKKLREALDGIGRALNCLELLGKLTGKLRPETQVNVLVTSPDWLAMRERIADALEPYPLALEAVKEAMSGE